MVSWLSGRNGVDRNGARPEAEAEARASLEGPPPALPSRAAAAAAAAARETDRFISWGILVVVGIIMLNKSSNAA
jgi:hypothetical protein